MTRTGPIAAALAVLLAAAAPPAAGPVPPPGPITIAAVGDLMLGSTYPDASGRALPPRDGADLLAAVAPVLAAADVAFGNLEGPLFDAAGPPHCSPGGIAERSHGRPGGKSCWAFRMPSRYGALLRAAGLDVLSIANNHIDDFGPEGRAGTIATLDHLGIAHSGPTGSVAHLHVRGQDVDVIAFAPYSGLNDMRNLDAVRALVAASSRTGALVVASFHGGAEGAGASHVPAGPETFWGEERGAVRAFAHAAVEAGADLVLGHGPHVVRALEVYRGRLIAYSLGTFASYRGISVSGVLGVTLILEARLAPDGAFLDGRVHPVRQDPPGGPHLDARATVVATLRALSASDAGAAAPRLAESGALLPPL